jgi:hypothetical protein
MSWADEVGESSPFSRAPEGLRETRGGSWAEEAAGPSPWLQTGWQTGGQLGTTTNAFNDDFFTRMYDQYEREQSKIAANSNYVSDLFLQKDFTGIVGWDQTFSSDGYFKGNEALKAGDRVFRTGDIYDNGEFLGNVYDKDSGLTLEEANGMVAPHIFGKDAADKYRAADGDQEKLHNMIVEQGKAEGQKVEAYVTRAPYQNAVNGLLDDWEDDWLDEALLTVAGVGGGVLAGAAFGIPGMIVGGIAGGVGSFMAADEARQQAAQAFVSTGIIQEQEGADAGAAAGIARAGEFGLSRLNVFTNLTSGIVDVAANKWGDSRSELRDAAYDGNVGSHVALGLAGFADGLLTASNKAATIAYTAGMGGTALGTAYNKAMHDGEWDEVTGSFHKYETVEQRLAAAGASAIDVAQMALPGLLRRSAANNVGGRASSGLDDLGARDDLARVTIMDRTFDVTNAGSGQLRALSESKLQSFVAWAVPSTAVNRLAVRGSAYSEVLKQGRHSVTADDLYQAAVRMERASVPWKLALVNGFGEATEEVLQTYLNATAVGWNAQPQEFLSAAIAGFSMGAGMSVGSRVGTVASDERARYRANYLLISDGQEPFTKAEWREVDPTMKRYLSTANKTAERMARSNKEDFFDDTEEQIVSSVVGLQAREDAVKAIMKRQQQQVGEDALEDMADILPFNSVRIPSHYALHSGKTTLDKLQNRLTGLAQEIADRVERETNKAEGAKPDPLLPNLEAVHETLRALVEQVRGLYTEYQQNADISKLEEINEILRNYWAGVALPETPKQVQQQAVELVFSRMPNDNPGSFQMLLPQIDLELEYLGAHGMTKVSQSLEKLLSHDNDGDKLKHMARYIPTPQARRTLRLGMNHWAPIESINRQAVDEDGNPIPQKGGGFLNVTKRGYEDAILTLMRFQLAGWDPEAKKEVRRTFDALVDFLKEALPPVRDETWTNFRSMLEKDPDGAKQELYRALAKDYSALISLGENGTRIDRQKKIRPEAIIPPDTSIGLWIEDQIQIHLEKWRDYHATRETTEFVRAGARGAQPSRLQAGTQSTPETPAATPGQTLGQRSGGDNQFRWMGGLQYGPINAVSVDADGRYNPSELKQAIIEWYTNLTRLRPYSAIETLKQGGSPVVREARADLENLARYYFPEMMENAATRDEALMRIAAAPFWNVDEEQAVTFDFAVHDPDATIGSVLIKAAAARQAALAPVAFGELDANEAYANTTPGRALDLLVGEIAPENVLPADQAAQLGAYSTFSSLVRDYTQIQTQSGRREWRAHKQIIDAYDDPNSLYRIFVDGVREAADKELAHGPREGENAGRAVGRLPREDRRFHDKTVIPIFQNIAHLANVLGLRDMTSRDAVIRALENNSRGLQQILALFPAEMQLQILKVPQDSPIATQFIMPNWFFNMIMEENAEKAALIYWDAMLQMDLDMHLDDDAPGNAWVKLYQDLDDEGRATLNELRASATDVQSFVEEVNRRVAFNRAPLMAYRTDTTLYDPSATKGGWQWSAPSAERRQALRDANAYFVGRAEALTSDLELAQKNIGYATTLLNAIQNPDKYKSAQLKEAVVALDNRLKQNQHLRQPAMAPAARRAFVQRSYRGIDPASASKGVSSPAIAQVGDVDVRRNQTMFGAQLDQTFAALLSGDVKNISFNPQQLLQELRLQTEQGAIIDWTPLTTEQFLQLFIAEDGAYQNLLFALINPSVYEENAAGRAIQQYLFPQDLEGIVTATFFKDLIIGNGDRSQVETDELFLSYIDSLTEGNLATRMLADSAIARSTKKGAGQQLTDGEYKKLVNDVARAIRSLMGLAEGDGESLRMQLNLDALKGYIPQDVVGEVFTGSPTAVNTKIQGLVQLYEAAVADAEAAYNRDKSLANAEALIDATQKLSVARGLDTTKKYGQLQLDAMKIDWSSDVAQRVSKTMITQYIETYGPELATTMTGEDAKVLSQWNLAQNDHMDIFKSFDEDPKKDQKVWDKLSKIVALHRTLTTSGYLASATISSPQTAEWADFDPTFTYLTNHMVTDDFLKVLVELRNAVPDAVPQLKDVKAVIKDLNSTILRKSNFGKWVPDLVMQHSGSNRYLDASGSPQQIAIGGELLKSHIATTISSRRTNLHPTPDMARAYSIDADDLLGSEDDIFALGLDGEPWALLENASVVAPRFDPDTGKATGTGPTLVAVDAQGKVIARVPLTMATSAIQNGGKTPDGSETTIARITHDSLIQAVKVAQSRFTPGSAAKMVIELQLFHPAMKPPKEEWANNVHFDGTLGATDAAPSIYGALLGGVDGLVQRLERAALDAIKGSLAIFTTAHPRGFDNKDPKQLLQLIHQITIDILNTPMGEEDYFPNSAYRGVFRMVRDRLLVVGRNAEGAEVVLSSEQALTGGMDELVDLKVVELSTRSLETLRGSTSGSGHPRALTRAPRAGGEGETWKGFYEQHQLDRMPRLGDKITDMTEIAEAFRTSGILDTERVQSFKYHSWTADDRKIEHRPFESFDAQVSSILADRRKPSNERRVFAVNETIAKRWRGALRQDQRVKKATVDELTRDLGGVKPNRKLKLKDAYRTLGTLLQYANSNQGRLFIVDPSNRGSAEEGMLRSVRDGQIGELYSHVAPTKDVVILQLDGFEQGVGTPEWNRAVADEIASMKERGLTIGLVDNTNPTGASLARDILMEMSGPYKVVNSDLFIFAPDEQTEQGRTLEARRASLKEAKRVALSGYVLAAYSEDGFYSTDAEAAFVDPRSDWTGFTQGYSSDVVPTTGQAQFHSPGTPTFGRRVKQVYDWLLANDGAAYLAEQTLLGGATQDRAALAAEFQLLLERAAKNLDVRTGRPKRNTELRPGDMVATINELGTLTFTRWGYDSTKVDFDAQDKNGLDGVERPGIPSTSSIRVVAGERLDSDKASLRGGIIDRWYDDPIFGLRALFKDDINLAGAKMVDEEGTKTRNVLLPENKRPTSPLLRGLLPAQYSDYQTPIKKGVASVNAMLNARQAIFMMGWDSSRALANALGYTDGHPDPDAVRWTVEEWADLDPQKRQAITARVTNTLRLQRIKEAERIQDEETLAHSVYKVSQVSETARILIEQEKGASLASAQMRAKLRGQGVNTDELAMEQLYLSAVMQYLKGNGTDVEHVLGSPGFDQDQQIENRESLKMPAILTQFIDMNLPLRRYVQGDMNARMEGNRYDATGGLLEGWIIKDDWRVFNRRADGSSNTVVLRAVRAEATGEDHSERSELNSDLATQDNASNQQQMFARETVGLDIGHGVRDPKLTKLLAATAYSEERVRDLTFGKVAERIGGRTSDEQTYRDENVTKAVGYIVPIDAQTITGTASEMKQVKDGYQGVYKKLGLVGNGQYKRVVDSMIRIYFRAVHDPEMPDADRLNAVEVIEALRVINAELAAYRWPMDQSGMPLLHADIVDLIARNGTWTPDNVTINGDKRAFMLESALNVTYDSTQEIPVEARRELDALHQTYEKYFSKGYWPASAYPEVIERLVNPKGEGFVSSFDPGQQKLLTQGDPYKEYDGVAPDPAYTGSGAGTKLEASRRRRSARERGKTRGGDAPQTVAQQAKRGAQYRDKVNFAAGFWRNAHAIRTITPQVNPWLWVWNPVDYQWRRMPGSAASLITGQSIGWAGRSIRGRVQWLADKVDSNLMQMDPETRSAKVLQAFKDAFGVDQPWITSEANDLLPEVRQTLLADIKFRQDLAEETRHRPDDVLLTRGDRNRQKAVDWASRSQDILRQLSSPSQVDAYIISVLEHERINNPKVTALQVLERLHRDPLSYKTKGPVGAHIHGVRTVQNFKGAKLTTAGALADRILIPLSESPNALLSGPANTLLLLAKFRNFTFSSAVQMMGGQAVDAAGAILLQALAFRKQAYIKAQGGETRTPTDYVGKVFETADFADMVIRSGLSLTGLFFASLAFNAFGLTGETEEERRKKRIEQLQGLGTLYDPRDIANSFLNENAVWLEGLDNTLLAPLAAFFEVPGAEGQPSRSPAQMHWTLNFFVAPVMGMAEFMQTGDFKDLADGFFSAIGNMPLVNTNFFWDAWTTSEQLYAAATDEVETNPGDGSFAVSQLIKVGATLEKMLLEFAFINELAAAQDQYIRDPWMMPKSNEAGTLDRTADGEPQNTDVMVESIDPVTGDVVERPETRSYEEGLYRSYTQNQQTLAFLSTLVTGFKFNTPDSFMRQDLGVRDVTIQKPELTDEEAETLVLSVWDPENEREVLTRDGQERLLDSLMAGTVRASDPALQNIFLTYDQRVELSDSLQKKIYVEGIEVLELDPEKALQRMYDIWNGPANNPYVQPLYDVVWSTGDFSGENGIGWNPTVQYRQLNTTWAMGPDGKMWATGVQRHGLMSTLGGVLPLTPYQGAYGTGIQGNLGVDEVGNSIDEVNQLNTGYRGLTRVNNNIEIPNEEDIIKAIQDSTKRVVDEIKDLNSDLYNNLRQYGGGYRYGRGGGGGGGGYANNPLMPFLNGMRTPYADNLPQIYIQNTNPRRASIRRERFSTERGRLNQQQ